MAIHYPDILYERSPPRRFTYGEREAILYALGVGVGDDPVDPEQLRFVYERDLKLLPTSATVLAGPPTWEREFVPEAAAVGAHRLSPLDYASLVAVGHKVILHRPLPPRGTFTTVTRTTEVLDKGANKGAIITNETEWFEGDDIVVTLSATILARGDGGFGGPRALRPPPDIPVSLRAPDNVVDLPTTVSQALLYRLNGDAHPIHVDPVAACAAGFARPILHGLCTFGITCRGVLQAMLDWDVAAIASHEARFVGPVFPGETIRLRMWREFTGIAFEADVIARGAPVVRHGWTALATSGGHVFKQEAVRPGTLSNN